MGSGSTSKKNLGGDIRPKTGEWSGGKKQERKKM